MLKVKSSEYAPRCVTRMVILHEINADPVLREEIFTVVFEKKAADILENPGFDQNDFRYLGGREFHLFGHRSLDRRLDLRADPLQRLF